VFQGDFLLTIILSFVVMGIIIAGLAIGLILTGKSHLRRGCGKVPGNKIEEGTSCSLCSGKKKCEQESDNEPDNSCSNRTY
jgi:hypothetical protein